MPEGMQGFDYQSPVWKKFVTDCEARLASLRTQNDGELDPVKTAVLRGRIREVKRILALDKPGPRVEADDGAD